MKRTFAGLASTALLIGTIWMTTTANAASKWNTHDDDVTDTAEIRLGVHQDLREIRHEIRAERRARHDRILERREREAAAAAEAAAVAPEPTITAGMAQVPSSGGWADELAAVGFPPEAISTMLYIIDRESGGCPTAVNGLSGCPSYEEAAALLASSERHACGLIQAFPCYGGAAWLDPITNLRVGYAKYEASGLSPWSM